MRLVASSWNAAIKLCSNIVFMEDGKEMMMSMMMEEEEMDEELALAIKLSLEESGQKM